MLRVTTVISGLAGAPAFSTLHWLGSGPVDAGNAAARTRAFWLNYQPLWAQAITCTVNPGVLEVDEVDGEITAAYSTGVTPFAGSNIANDPVPAQTQALTTLFTEQYYFGRRVSGRIFVPGLQDGNNTGGRVATGGVGTAAAGGLVAALQDVQVGVWSRPQNSQLIPRPGKFFPALGAVARPTWAVLRSRR